MNNKKTNTNNKLIVILGPTASGKSDLAVRLAKRFNGEIISADSRQVYRGLDIGSGKITKKEMMGIPHHLLDVTNPRRKFSVAQYQKLTLTTIQQIEQRGRTPFLVGGTGLYIQSIVDGIILPEVKPNWGLRRKLERLAVKELHMMLEKLDPERADNIDSKNPHRLIRAIEIAKATKKPIKPLQKTSQFDTLQIGIIKSKEELKKLIAKRLQKRLQGMITEVKKLRHQGVSFKRLEEFGLEYRAVAQYLQSKITQEEMRQQIQKESEQYAKRQMTWFKRDQRIHWVKNYTQAHQIMKKALH